MKWTPAMMAMNPAEFRTAVETLVLRHAA